MTKPEAMAFQQALQELERECEAFREKRPLNVESVNHALTVVKPWLRKSTSMHVGYVAVMLVVFALLMIPVRAVGLQDWALLFYFAAIAVIGRLLWPPLEKRIHDAWGVSSDQLNRASKLANFLSQARHLVY